LIEPRGLAGHSLGVLKHSLPVAINRVPVTLNQDMKALLRNSILPDFLARALQALAIEAPSDRARHTADNISTDVLRRMSFPSPAGGAEADRGGAGQGG